MMKNVKNPQRWSLHASERRFILLLGDAFVAALSLFGALYLWATQDAYMTFSWEFIRSRPEIWFFLLPVMWLLLLVELYDLTKANSTKETLKSIGLATVISVALYLIVYFTSEPNSLPRQGVLFFIGMVAGLTLIWRLVYIKIFTAPRFLRRVLVVGAGKAGTALLTALEKVSPPPFRVIGLIDDDPQKANTVVCGVPVIGSHEQMITAIYENGISDIVLAITGEISGQMFQSLLSAQELGLVLTTMPIIYEETLGRVPIFLLEAEWVVRSFVEHTRASTFYQVSKRIMDFIGGLIGSILTTIALPFIALAILIDSGRPIFFVQERVGRGGEPYGMIKFRTMVQDAEADGRVTTTHTNDARITRVGNILRKTHLDEIPQFYNVLKGDMSLVGPRAERSELVAVFQEHIPFYRARLLVKPGLSGWAQVNYGYAETVEETATKLEYDLYYIEHRTLWMDISIIMRTVGTMVGFKGR